MTLQTLADEIYKLHSISRSMIQQTTGNWPGRGPRNSGGGFTEINQPMKEFRVVLGAGKKLADVTKPTLREAVDEAFKVLGMEVPEALK